MADSPKKKHPLLEREFLMALATLIGGVVLLALGKEQIGTALISVAVGGYGLSRGLAKIGSGTAKVMGLVMLPLLLIGCCGAALNADAIDDTLTSVVERHNKWLDAGKVTGTDKDGNDTGKLPTKLERDVWILDGEVLLKALEKAKAENDD